MVNRGEEKVRVHMNVVPRFTILNRPRLSLSDFVADSRQSNGRSNPEVVGSISHRGQNIFSLPRVVPCFPLLGLTPSGYSWV